jgi:DNA polymerase (family 10)
MNKHAIAGILDEIGVLLELKDENPFKVRAYRTGARALETLEEDLDTVIAENRLQEIKGIGEALAKKIVELHATGRLEFFEKLKASVAPGLIELLEIPGLGPKKIKVLHERLGISSVADLARACGDGQVEALDGFGKKTQEKLLAGIRNREAYGRRHRWWDAAAVAEPLLQELRALPQVKRAEHAGSLRRGLETVGDLDFIVAAEDWAPIVHWFVSRPGVAEVTAQGETKASVRFANGLQADLRIVPPDQFVFALHHFTGSKDHNVQMRQRAQARGLSLSEWGLVPAGGEGTAKEKVEAQRLNTGAPSGAIQTEAGLFAALGLHNIPPELREGLGEIEAAEQGEFPRLVELGDLRGVFHNHTTASDGRNTLVEMVAGAEARGWEYFGVADHSQASFQANGLDAARLRRQIAEIAALNGSGRYATRVLAGVECDILADGRLDLDESVLRELDYVVVSVHSGFTQSEAEMTARIIRAIEHPCTTMLGHLTGRLLLKREGYAVNVSKVIDAALANGVAIELNANPQRLDMDWRHWRAAAGSGLLCVINPDAHDVAGLDFCRAGINSARKGGLTAAQVLNTRSLYEIENYLRVRKQSTGAPAHAFRI